MNIKKIQELVELMNNNDLTEVEIEEEGTKIRLIRRPQGIVEQHIVHAPVAAQPVMAQPPVAGQPGEPEGKAAGMLEVKSPMVGTFYKSPSPDSDPYVKVGDIVHKGDVLCIVEAMKLMNEVKSEFEGRITNILVENAEPIEFGQTMFLLEPV